MLGHGLLAAAEASAADGEMILPALGGHVSVLDDRASALTLSDILDPARQAEFRPVAGQDANFGYVDHAVWVRLAIPADATGQGILSLTPNFLDMIDIYAARPGRDLQWKDFVLHKAGDHRPPPRDGISGLDNAVRLEFVTGETTYVYVRILNTNSSTHLNLELVSPEERGRGTTATASAFGMWLGGMAVLLITQFVFFYFDRKAQYPLLAFSTLGVMLIYAGNLGYSHVYLFPLNGAANDLFLGFNAWAGLTASALAYASILDLRKRAPWLHRAYLFTAAVGVVGVGFALAGKNILFGPFGSMFGIVMATVNMIQGMRYANVEGAASRLTAAAFTALCLGAVMSMAQRLGLGWLPNWTAHSYGIAGLIQTTLLTGALAVRLRDAKALNRRMQDEALRSARIAEQTAASLVEERTRELVQARKTAEEALQAEKEAQLRQVRFLEVVSHQYRTPLGAMRSSIESFGLAVPVGDERNRG
ncbi:7TM-DISM domain-containing protein, partial [Rhizobiaceae sp. 2RAB30]